MSNTVPKLRQTYMTRLRVRNQYVVLGNGSKPMHLFTYETSYEKMRPSLPCHSSNLNPKTSTKVHWTFAQL